MNKLIFIGGNRGVGKTSLANSIREKLQVPYVQYSEFNIQKAMERWGRLDWVQLSEPENASWVNNEFITYVNETVNDQGKLLIDGHYSYYDSPSFSVEEFQELVHSKESLLVLVKASLESLLKRIKKDKRDRSLDPKKIIEDIQCNRQMFEVYSSGIRTHRYVLLNEDFESSQKRLTERVNQFLSD